ncbi:MAG: beta-ketoacyl-[acyl-carrier-protein] synthase family protein [Planctomycetales bacterium]|nr:beta-ketoacyl-[acyl-carrier-protein] synthase family protein [Planctomycetales bacterium]
MREVVVTGLGIVSPIGVGVDDCWAALEGGVSGVRVVPELAAAGHPIPIAGEVVNFEPKQYVKPRKALKVMSRETQLGFSAAELAWEQAALEGAGIAPERLGVLCGSNMFCPELPELAAAFNACRDGDGAFDENMWGPASMAEMFPLWLLKYLPNMVPAHIGIAHDLRGPSNSVVAGDTSGLLAVIESADIIARGAADVMLAGGVSSMLGMMDMMWHAGARLSRRIDEPARASRPFDANRDGTVGAEGAAILVLETREHAAARGVTALATLHGHGRTCEPSADAHQPTGRAIAAAISAALQSSQLSPSDVGVVVAQGTSTQLEDRIEAAAITETLGETPVTALKSYLGNAGAGAGAIELALAIVAARKGVVPATLNYDTPDPACPVNVSAKPRSLAAPTMVAINHRITGQAVALAASVD